MSSPIQMRAALWFQWLFAAGCVYDAEHRCGSDRHLEGRVCVCNKGSEEREGACQPALPDAGAGGLGSACQFDEECSEGDHPVCTRSAGGDYCTQSGCTRDEDCPAPYFCVEDAAPSFCSRPPTGQGMPCDAAADCQGFDATFCGVGDPRGATCWVPDCTDGSCQAGYMCFDLSTLLPGAPKACVK